jgi:hypothetical protein
MPPNLQAQQQEQHAVAAARKLQDLLRGAKLCQLLQQAPPAALKGKQQKLMHICSLALKQLREALQELPTAATAGQQLSSVLQLEAAQHAAALVVWALQWQELLQAKDLCGGIAVDTVTGVWFFANAALKALAAVLEELGGSSSAQLTLNFTQQLERSSEQHEASRIQSRHVICDG